MDPGFIWPITGPISSYFGPRHPLGIDIDLYGRAGTPIVAARGGTPLRVVFQKLDIKPVHAARGADVKRTFPELLDGSDPRQR